MLIEKSETSQTSLWSDLQSVSCQKDSMEEIRSEGYMEFYHRSAWREHRCLLRRPCLPARVLQISDSRCRHGAVALTWLAIYVHAMN